MSNLIITIISIALVAVATMMAVYYGGSAYENATAQAMANQLVSDSQQIAAAYQVYSQANGGTLYEQIGIPVGSDNSFIDFQFLVGGEEEIYLSVASKFPSQTVQLPSYLNTLPLPPAAITTGDGSLVDNSYTCGSKTYDYDNSGSCLHSQGLGGGAICLNCRLPANTPTVIGVAVIFPMYGNVANSYASATPVQLQVCQDIANKARGQGAPIDTTYFIDYSTSLFDCAAEDPNVGGAGVYDFVYRIF